MPRDTAVVSPNLGLYLGRSPLAVPPRALTDGQNFRIENGTLQNINLGWERYSAVDFQMPVTLIDTFVIRGGEQRQIIGTTRDLFNYDADTDTADYINARYATGTANVAGNDSFTKALLHWDGTDASTTMTDSNLGGSAHTWTAHGNAQLDTADKKFGVSSLLLDGTGDYIDTPDHADYTLGSGAFTIDLWFKCTAAGGTNQFIAGQADGSITDAGTAWGVYRRTSNDLEFFLSNGVSHVSIFSTSTFTNAVNTGWHHLAVIRTGNTLRMFIDGTQQGGDQTFSGSVANSAAVLAVGAIGAAVVSPWTGWIDEFRMSVGVARWTSNFTPPGAEYVAANKVSGEGTLWLANAKAGDFISFGSATQTDPTATWYEIASVDSNTQLTIISGPTTPQSPLYTIRSTFTGNITDLWETVTFVAPDDGTGDDLWFATNGVDYIVTWDGNADQVVVRSALAFKCRELNVYKNMMIYANIQEDGGDSKPTSFFNSDIGKPLDVSGGLAAEFRAHSGTDQILTLSNLGDNLAIYSEETVTLIQFVGDPLIFVFRDVSNGVGLIGQRLMANFGDYHEFLSADSQYLFDGATLNEIGKQVWRDVLQRRDQTRRPLGHTHFALERGELHWIIPLTSDAGVGDDTMAAERSYVEHYLEEVGDRTPTPFSTRESPWLCNGYGVTAGALTFDEVTSNWEDNAFRWNDSQLFAAFPISLMGSSDGHVYKINGFQTANGTPLVSFAITGRRGLGDGRMRGLLTRVYPYSENTSQPLDVTVRLTDHAEGPITTSDTQVFDGTLPEGEHFVSPFRRGRYFELKFGSNGTPWSITGYDTDVRQGGFR